MHFEVFRPDVVIIRKNASKSIPGGFKDIEKFLDRQLKAFDLLYKARLEDSAAIVSLFGRDSQKASNYLVSRGIADRR
jgi:hypothetical protein